MNKPITIRHLDGSVMGDVAETTSLVCMKQNCREFFRQPFGKRETYAVYRGQLIVRYSSRLSSVRMTVPYLYFHTGELANDTLCVSTTCKNMLHAKRVIDKVLDSRIWMGIQS